MNNIEEEIQKSYVNLTLENLGKSNSEEKKACLEAAKSEFGLVGKEALEWTWLSEEEWKISSGRMVMLVEEDMKIKADSEGNWNVSYKSHVYCQRHRYTYFLHAYSAAGTKLFTLTLPIEDRNSGRHNPTCNGNCADIRRDWPFIFKWFREGSGDAWL